MCTDLILVSVYIGLVRIPGLGSLFMQVLKNVLIKLVPSNRLALQVYLCHLREHIFLTEKTGTENSDFIEAGWRRGQELY